MKNIARQSVFILGILSIAGIVAVQVYLVRQAFDIREKQFNQSVQIALKTVAENLAVLGNVTRSLDNPVSQLSPNYYVVNLNSTADVNLLEENIREELGNVKINIDFEYGIYDCYTNKMMYGDYVCMNQENCSKAKRMTTLPRYSGFDYYFVVHFPTRSAYLVKSMELWIVVSVLLFVVIVFFAWSMVIIFRQRFISQAQKDFMNNMAHEFKTPITSISIASTVLADPGISTDQRRMMQYVEYIRKESLRLDYLVEKVLQITRMERSDFSLDKQTISAHRVIDNVVKQFTLNNTCPPESISVHAQAENDEISGDAIHFSNVLYNIIDNAIKYSPGIVDIKVSTCCKKDVLCISVTDKGIGIEKKYLDKVFERFYRIPTGDIHNVKGFGIGLNYVKRIVKAHGWGIDISSKPREGTTVSIKIHQRHA